MQRKALELRKAGATHDQIAEQLGVANRSVAWKLVRSAIVEIVREPAEEVLQIELARLDAMLLGCWTKAKSGDPHAIDRALRIMDRRAKYLGLDAPTRTEHGGIADGAPIAITFSEQFTDDQLRAIAAAADPGGGTSDPGGGSEGTGPERSGA